MPLKLKNYNSQSSSQPAPNNVGGGPIQSERKPKSIREIQEVFSQNQKRKVNQQRARSKGRQGAMLAPASKADKRAEQNHEFDQNCYQSDRMMMRTRQIPQILPRNSSKNASHQLSSINSHGELNKINSHRNLIQASAAENLIHDQLKMDKGRMLP